MAFSILNNVASANAQANLNTTNIGLNKALNRLSSGLRINSSGDDAAGLAVANGYRSNVAVLNQGLRNAADGMSTLQIMDGALNNISNLIDRLSTLASQSASSSASVDRTVLNAEFRDVIAEIDREAAVTAMTSGARGLGGFSVFVSNDGANGSIGGYIAAADTNNLQIDGLYIDTAWDGAAAVSALATAVTTLGGVQAQVGTLENRLQHAISLAQSQIVNNTAAESRIRDANVAEEASNLTKFNILTQAGIASLAQANQSIGAVLSLLR